MPPAWVNEILDAIEATSSLEDLNAVAARARDRLEVAHTIYHTVGVTGREYGAMTYDPDWVAHYKDERFFNFDPAVLATVRSTGPVDWRTLDWSPPGPRRVIAEAVANGVGKQGLSVPLRGVAGQVAMFSVTSFEADGGWTRFLDAHRHNLVLIGHAIHLRAAQLQNADRIQPSAELSPRERDVLSYLSIGKSRPETADALGISEHTLRAYLDTARLKLNATNTTHAVAVALSRGLIVP